MILADDDDKAVIDVPAACFAEELILAYPDAKVILLERNIHSWYESVIETVLKPRPRLMSWFLSFMIYAGGREMGQLVQLKDAIDRDLFGPGGLEESNVRKIYSEYHERIRRLVLKV